MWRCLVTDQKSWNYSTLVHEHFEIFCKSAKHPHTLDVVLPAMLHEYNSQETESQLSATSRHIKENIVGWFNMRPMDTYGYALSTVWKTGDYLGVTGGPKKCFLKKLLLSGILFDKISSTLNYASRPSGFSCLINHTYHKVNQCPIKIHTRLSLRSSSTLLSWTPQSTTKGHHQNCATNCLNFSCKHRTVGTTERILSWRWLQCCTRESMHPIRLLTFMWHVGRPTAAIHLEFFGQTWLHPKTIKNIQKFWRPRGLLLPLNQLRARQWVCLFCLRQLQMLDSPATCPSPCHSQITNLRKAQVVLLHNFWERYLRGTEYISDIFCYIPLPFNFSVHWSQFKIEIGKKTNSSNFSLQPSTLM